jgi:hypothetical protein
VRREHRGMERNSAATLAGVYSIAMATNPQLPSRLWKYRPWNDFTADLIVKGHVYFSTVKQLNDPFEFRWREVWPEDRAEIDHFAREMCSIR